MRILVLHGPNLNLLGEREPEIYGSKSLSDINQELVHVASVFHDELKFLQSNHEGILIDKIHEERNWMDALIMNPGALTHYSYSLRDAVSSVKKPMIEVHLSNILEREEFRRNSVFDGLPNIQRIIGRGWTGYIDALRLIHTVHSSAHHS